MEVTAVNVNQVTINLPLHWTYDTQLDPWAYQVDGDAMIRNAGLEDLTLTQDNPAVEFMIEMDGAQYSWIKNVEISNIQRRANPTATRCCPSSPMMTDENVIWVLGVGSGVNDPNVAATLRRHGNYDYVTHSVVWDPAIANHSLSDSLYLSAMPDWWCKETPWPAIGPEVAGYAQDIPAKRRFEGLPCTPARLLTLNGYPANQAIYLAWEVVASLPVTSTWQISYTGLTGDQPSPIGGLSEVTRAYQLTGLTNYVPYAITLNAMLGSTPILTGTLSLMPSDISLHLPVVLWEP